MCIVVQNVYVLVVVMYRRYVVKNKSAPVQFCSIESTVRVLPASWAPTISGQIAVTVQKERIEEQGVVGDNAMSNESWRLIVSITPT